MPSVSLLEELKALRKGRGVYAHQIDEQVGPGLRALCGISGDDDPAAIRLRPAQRLSALIANLPADLGLAVAAALVVHPDARHAFLPQRIQCWPRRSDGDARAARRRMDLAIAQLAEAAILRSRSNRSQCVPRPCGTCHLRWHVGGERTSLRSQFGLCCSFRVYCALATGTSML